MELKAGTRLRSATDSTEVVVVKAAAGEIDLCCGGVAMLPVEEAPSSDAPQAGFDGGTEVGKRYCDDDTGIEVLCTKAGAGSLSLGSQPLMVKGAKALPSSD